MLTREKRSRNFKMLLQQGVTFWNIPVRSATIECSILLFLPSLHMNVEFSLKKCCSLPTTNHNYCASPTSEKGSLRNLFRLLSSQLRISWEAAEHLSHCSSIYRNSKGMFLVLLQIWAEVFLDQPIWWKVKSGHLRSASCWELLNHPSPRICQKLL